MKGSEDERTPKEHESAEEKEDRNKLFKVFLGGIPRTMDEDELYTVFRKYKPTNVMVMREMTTKRSRGFAFITFENQNDMDTAISELHNTRIDGRLVTVSKARPFEHHRERSPRRNDMSDRRRPYRRYDDDDRHRSTRHGGGGYQNKYYDEERNDYQSVDYFRRNEHEDDGYNSRRGMDSYDRYYPRHSDRRSSGDRRSGRMDDRRQSRYPPNSGGGGGSSSSYRETRRERWRSRSPERSEWNRGGHQNQKTRNHGSDHSPGQGAPSRHRHEGGRRPVEQYSRGSSDLRMQ